MELEYYPKCHKISKAADAFFNEIEEKGILDLPPLVKYQLHEHGYTCKAAFYYATDAKLEVLFKEIRKELKNGYEYDLCIHPDQVFRPAHRDQIKFLAKYIKDEFNGKAREEEFDNLAVE